MADWPKKEDFAACGAQGNHTDWSWSVKDPPERYPSCNRPARHVGYHAEYDKVARVLAEWPPEKVRQVSSKKK